MEVQVQVHQVLGVEFLLLTQGFDAMQMLQYSTVKPLLKVCVSLQTLFK
jgi:hypothetical protein